MKLDEVMASNSFWKGTVEPLTEVDPRDVIEWIEKILPLDDSLLDAWSDRHVMISDPNWNGFYKATDELVSQIMTKHFSPCSDKQRMISVVQPGKTVARHRDDQALEWIVRIHVPLLTNEEAWFYSAGVPHNMKVGTAYLVNTKEEHEIVNKGPTARIHFMFDVIGPYGYGVVQ